jgi:hypothetical protein
VTYLEKEVDAIYRAYADYQQALEKLQAECEHRVVLEAGRQDNMWGDLPYIRVCEDCGTEEESAWGSRWNVLAGRAYPVSRAQVYECRPKQTYIPSEVIERYKA